MSGLLSAWAVRSIQRSNVGLNRAGFVLPLGLSCIERCLRACSACLALSASCCLVEAACFLSISL